MNPEGESARWRVDQMTMHGCDNNNAMILRCTMVRECVCVRLTI